MKKSGPTPSSATPELFAEWRERIDHLDALIASRPADQWRWLWEIRRDILAHLLHRHAGDALPKRIKTAVVEGIKDFSASTEAPDTFVDAYIRGGSTTEQTHVGAHPPREGSALRDRLKRLQEQNAERYAHLALEIQEAQQRIFAYLHRNDPFSPVFTGPSNLSPREQQQALAQAWSQALEVLVAQSVSWTPDNPSDAPGAQAPMSEDEILGILLGKESQPLPEDGSREA